jgi:iron-sulfur cluster repair protein YtfE (RIC family)
MTTSTSKTQTQAQTQLQPFSAEQRKGMARLLADTRKRLENGLESDHDLSERIEAEALPKLAEERGATSLVEKVRRLHKEHEEAEEALGKLGFAWSEFTDCLSLDGDAPKELRQALERAQRAARRERDAELLKYDKAILKVWAAEDADEAKEIVEELL